MKNYRIKQYIKKQLVYSPLEHIDPDPSFLGIKLEPKQLTYNQVKGVINELQKKIDWGMICNVFMTCYGITEKQFYNGHILEFFQARNFIIKEFKRIAKREKKLLSAIAGVDAELWKQAGGKRLDPFHNVLPINQLGKIYGKYPFDLKDKKYEEILLLLTIEKTQREVQSKFDKLRAEKNKPKRQRGNKKRR